jgi:phage head maturation protease
MSFPAGGLLRPGMRYTFWSPAGTFEVPGKGEFPERFAPGAFDRTVGTVVPLTYEGSTIGRGRVISAEVAADGSGVSITYEVLEPDHD